MNNKGDQKTVQEMSLGQKNLISELKNGIETIHSDSCLLSPDSSKIP